MEWQTIESAPKDCTTQQWVILNTSLGVTVGYWGPTYFDYDYAWVQYNHRSESVEVEGEITHWMPLPPPPANDNRKDG